MSLCKTITDYSSNGSISLLYSIRDCIPFAFEGLLLAIFLILFAGQFFLIQNKTGRVKILIALLSSSFMMIILSMLLALTLLVTFKVVLFYAFVCIISFILFMISDNS